MKNLRPILLLLFILLSLADSSFSQRKFGGRVSEIIDGKTVVIEMESGKLTAVLQFIEIPEPEQPLYRTVREHLEKLVLGKYVDFQPQGILPTKTLGRLYLNDVDIGQQMLRDGAAWHLPDDQSGQNTQESAVYQNNQAQAKSEKRGVWSIDNLKPAWEFRSAKDETERQKKIDEWNVYLENSAANKGSTKLRSGRQTAEERMRANENVGIWPEISDSTKGPAGGFLAGYDRNRKEGYTATPVTVLNLTGLRFGQKVEFRTIYVYRGDPNAIQESAFLIGFLSQSQDQKFETSNGLTIIADKQNIALGSARRLSRRVPDGVQELLLYKIGAISLKQIANAKKLTVRLGRYSGPMAGEVQDSIRQLIEMSDTSGY